MGLGSTKSFSLSVRDSSPINNVLIFLVEARGQAECSFHLTGNKHDMTFRIYTYLFLENISRSSYLRLGKSLNEVVVASPLVLR